MRYYLMEPHGGELLPKAPKSDKAEVVKASDLGRFSEIDYDTRSELISDRLKRLFELFLSRYDFVPVVYLDMQKKEQAVFWRFRPDVFEDYKAEYRNDGVVSRITYLSDDAPITFTARSPKGVRSIIVRMAVTESALRRAILGLKFTKIFERNEEPGDNEK